MSEPGKKLAIAPADALDAVRRNIVAVHCGPAEHGPEAAQWAMRELRGVSNYIQAVRKAQAPSSGAKADG